LIFRLDYCGIAILIVGSDIPLLYYQFHCEFGTKVAYLTLIALLGIGCMVVSMWDKFSSPQYRIYRACKFFFDDTNNFLLYILLVLFITFGIFGLIPTYHYIIRFGIKHALTSMITNFFLFIIKYHYMSRCQ
jgi:adiponectin receptor